MTDESTVLVDQRGHVRRLTLNRPAKLNALDSAMELRFHDAVDAAMRDPETRVVVVAGAGRAFSTGFDLNATPLVGLGAGIGTGGVSNAVGDTIDNRERIARWLRLWAAPKPIVAEVHGYCIGIANELVACCDLIVCSEDVQFGMPETREFALPPTLAFWPIRIGLARTKELLFTGRLVGGKEAVAIGMANAVMPAGALRSYVDELSAQVAEVPAARLAVLKQAANAWAETWGIQQASLRGAEHHALFHQTHDASLAAAAATAGTKGD